MFADLVQDGARGLGHFVKLVDTADASVTQHLLMAWASGLTHRGFRLRLKDRGFCLQVRAQGSGGSAFGFRAQCRVSAHVARERGGRARGACANGVGSRVSGVVCRVKGFGCRVLGFGCTVSGAGFRL